MKMPPNCQSAERTRLILSLSPPYKDIVDMYENTYTFPMFAARLGNAYSSTNVDLVNTGVSSEFANDEYLDPTDPLKDVREWAKAGISYEEMAMLMPGPPASEGRQSDIMNPEYVDMVVVSQSVLLCSLHDTNSSLISTVCTNH